MITKPINKFSKFITSGKDKVDKLDKSGVVYKKDCKKYGFAYIGQTSRKLKKRIYEHQSSIKKKYTNSALAEHCLNLHHIADFDNVKI